MANSSFPSDFPIPKDESPGKGQPIGGFGGKSDEKRPHHRKIVKEEGRSPIILIHGHAASADHFQWGLVTLKEMLKAKGYPEELIWAPSYLGFGEYDTDYPHTNNVNEVRNFIDEVCEYLDVDVVDIIAHSLGCTLTYAVFRGLKRQRTPVDWDQPKKWHKVGTFVSLDGALHGFGSGYQYEEWDSSSEFMRELLSNEKAGGGPEIPYGEGRPKTPEPCPHNIRYFCAVARGSFVDNAYRNTGRLEDAVWKEYTHLGSDPVTIHKNVKEDQTVFDDFYPYLNSVRCKPCPSIEVLPESGHYSSPLTVTVKTDSSDSAEKIKYTARKIIKEYKIPYIKESITKTLEGTLENTNSFTLPEDGMWEVAVKCAGTEGVKRIYYVGVPIVKTEIPNDNSLCFKESLTIKALITEGQGTLYCTTDKSNVKQWSEGDQATITENSTICFIAINSDGIASDIVCKTFNKCIPCENCITSNSVEHFVAKRIDVNEFLRYCQEFGCLTKIKLCLVKDEWVIDPCKVEIKDLEPPTVTCSHESGPFTEPITVKLLAKDNLDPEPKIYYTLDGSQPKTDSPFFSVSGQITFDSPGTKILHYIAQDASGNSSNVEKRTYDMDIKDLQPVITAQPESGPYGEALTVTIKVIDDKDDHVTVYYTLDGSKPDEKSSSFEDSKDLEVAGNGNYAITCYAKDSSGNETYKTFYYVIDDHNYPVTEISPSWGGTYPCSVEITLTPSEDVEWTKYTTDGETIPDDEKGELYKESFKLTKTTTLIWGSKDKQGNIEAVNKVDFKIVHIPDLKILDFDNDRYKDGYVKARPDGGGRSLSASGDLAIGTGWDRKVSRAILHFDTSRTPDNVTIKKAYLEVTYARSSGNPWSDGNKLVIDISKGYLGSSINLQSDDWDDRATAEGVASIDKFSSGTQRSGEFSQEGIDAINKTGITQIRLRFDPHPSAAYNYIFIKEGAGVQLFVEYEVECE